MPRPVVAKDNVHLKRLIAREIQNNGPACSLNHIDVSNVEFFVGLFKDTLFNGDVSQWNMERALLCAEMFANTPFNGDVSRWRLPAAVDTNNMFANSPFNGHVSQWQLPVSLLNAQGMFGTAFQQSLGHWNVPMASLGFSGGFAGMVQPQFRGSLPFFGVSPPRGFHTDVLGGETHLQDYLLQTSFSHVHALELLLFPEECGWASQEMVREAQEMGKMGRAVGMSEEDILRLVVQSQHERTTSSPIPEDVHP